MLLDPSDLISRVLLETGEWDPDTWTSIAGHLPAGGTFVDVGAHMGHCSLMASTVVGPRGRIIAIEANPETVALLRRNIFASAAEVEVLPEPCSESESLVDLWVASHSNSGSSSISKTNASLAGNAQTSYRVASRTLDSVLSDLGVNEVDVLKIDVEGAEMGVLQGARKTLSGCRPILMIELDDQLLATMGASSDEVRRFLASFGYRQTGLFDDANFLFMPDEEYLSPGDAASTRQIQMTE
jgi:FkbM family methyltransferase